MHDGGRILAGLLLFLAVVVSPILYQSVTGAEVRPPELVLPTEARQCVAPTSYMRVLHMDLLNNWRNEAVRTSDRIHVGPDDKQYDKSLTGTCLACHSNKGEFCDRCHEYAGVDVFCWHCHAQTDEIHDSFSWTRLW